LSKVAVTVENPSILPFPLEVLVYRTLDRWDDIVVVLQRVDDDVGALIFHDANRPFYHASGYSDAELRGQPFSLITGPDTDPAALADLTEAARENRTAKIELLCAGKAGQAFWLGMHLMPVTEAPTLFVALGRDITETMLARRRQATMQGLLAKVFLSVDAAVAIVGNDGKFLMTNPFLDRLLGHPPNSLVGRTTLDLVASGDRASVSAARDRQIQDGKEYSLDTSLLRIDGTLVPCHVHSTVIEALDRRKFRIVTARPLATPSPDAKPMRAVIAGKIKLVGLEEVKTALGDRWPATAERAMASAEQIIRRRCGPRDTFSRSTDSGFLICFADLSEADASFRAAMIAKDIRHHLIGKGENGTSAYVSAITTTVQVPDTPETAGPRLTALISRNLATRLHEIEDRARVGVHAILNELACEIEPIHGRNPEQVIAEFVVIPQDSERQICSALAALPVGEAQAIDLDAVLLDLAASQATEGLSRGMGQPMFVDIGFEVFEARAHTERYIAACRRLDARLRQRLVLVLTDMPESTPRSRMLDCITRLRPFCRMVGLAIDRPAALPADLSLSGAPIVVMEAPALVTAPLAEQAKLIGRLHISRTQLLVRHVSNWAEGAALIAAGVDMLSVVKE
jgi:PAS domain S-box-containing protein